MDVGEEEVTELDLAALRRSLASLHARAVFLKADVEPEAGSSEHDERRRQHVLQLAGLRARIDSLAAQVGESEDRVAAEEARGELLCLSHSFILHMQGLLS